MTQWGRYVEKIVPLDEDEIIHRKELAKKYRDRANERRQQEDQINNEYAVMEGEKIKLSGLDFDMLRKNQQEIQSRDREIQRLREVKEKAAQQMQKLSENQMKFKKIQENQQQQKLQEKRNNEQVQLQKLQQQQKLLMLQEKQRQEEQASDDDDDIFKDIQNNKSINSTPSVNQVEKNNTYEYEKLSQFNLDDYVAGFKNMSKAEEEAIQKKQDEMKRLQQEKSKKQLKMLQEQEDYYMECYPKLATSIEEDMQKQKEQNDLQEQLMSKGEIKQNQRSVHFRGGNNQRGGQKKKKRVDFNKQFEDIEKIIKKNKGQ